MTCTHCLKFVVKWAHQPGCSWWWSNGVRLECHVLPIALIQMLSGCAWVKNFIRIICIVKKCLESLNFSVKKWRRDDLPPGFYACYSSRFLLIVLLWSSGNHTPDILLPITFYLLLPVMLHQRPNARVTVLSILGQSNLSVITNCPPLPVRWLAYSLLQLRHTLRDVTY